MTWPLLQALSDTERAALLANTRRRVLGRGEVLFHEGDTADALYLVESGHLAVRVSTPDGERVTLNVLRGGDVVGELSLLEDGKAGQRSATVLALEGAVTRVLSRHAFAALCESQPGVRPLLALALAHRVRELSGRLLEAMYVGLDRRVHRRLLELHHSFGHPNPSGGTSPPDRVEIPLTQEQLADLVGGTRPSVNQVLQRLAAQQVVELGRGRVVVVDEAALRRKAGLG